MSSLFSTDESLVNRVHQHGAHEEQLRLFYPLVSPRSDPFAVRKQHPGPVARICSSAASLWPGSGLWLMELLPCWSEGKYKLLHPLLPICFTNLKNPKNYLDFLILLKLEIKSCLLLFFLTDIGEFCILKRVTFVSDTSNFNYNL